ncbi:MAG TPA: type II toxin-antitoxin system Phd/YefM family antitoxin [Nitrosomonas sp.]|nr:type II toxin-antitoxin system Phd/YefM family antitoxin [Nitrosomonas sp.]
MDEWRIADAKNKFSELFNNALIGRIQLVHRRDGDVVIISKNEYERLIGQKKSFKQYILSPPHEIDHLDDMRDKSSMRSVDL